MYASFASLLMCASARAVLMTRTRGTDTDCNEHGTHVSGIIGALANNYGFSGVAPHVDLGMYRVFGCEGSAADDIVSANEPPCVSAQP